MRQTDTLHAAVTGTSDGVPRIVSACWEAINLRLRVAPPEAWTDAQDLAADVGYFLDASPALAAELLAAGIDTGALEVRTHHDDRPQVRRARRDRAGQPRRRSK
mgnify:CR=1 FL=1